MEREKSMEQKPPSKKPAPQKPVGPHLPPKTVNQRPPSQLISNYRKRQQAGPFIIWGGVVLLIVVGLIMIVVWLTSGGGPKFTFTLFATDTPTPTITPSPTNTFTPTNTPTETPTPTVTFTPTPSAPFKYVVEEGDYLSTIVEKFNLGENGIQLILLLNPYNPENGTGIDPTTLIISVGQELLLPYPGMPLPSATPIPSDLPRGTKINYTIQPGETLASIAAKFNSTIDDILAENNIEDANAIQAYEIIVVRVNLVTPTITPNPTITPGATVTPGAPATEMPTLTPTP